MKIAAASNNGIMLTGHIGRCNMFLVYDIQDNKIINIERRENSSSEHVHLHEHQHENRHEHNGHENEHHCCHQGGEGKAKGVHNQRHAEVLNKLNDCKYVICNSAGKGMINDLEQNKISVILTHETDVKMAVERFISGELKNDSTIECSESKN